MAYLTGTSTSIEDLMQQLSTFLQANGWTEDFAGAGEPGNMGLSKNGIFVAFQYTELSDGGTLAIYQNFSNDNSTNVWLSTGDSGQLGNNILTPTSFDLGRCINLVAGPHAAFHFFEQNANPAYCHIVLEPDTNRFRHFGFGELEKIGDWIGGEYCYGHFWAQNVTLIDSPGAGSHGIGMDGGSQSVGTSKYASMHVRGQPEQAAGDRWALVGFGGGFPLGVDRAGNDRLPCIGSIRGGIIAPYMSQFRFSQLTAFKPLLPIPILVSDSVGAPDTARLMGTQPDVRVINIANIDPSETFVIAGETWFVFPWVRKQFLLNDTEESHNAGLAYRQELA